MKSLFIFRRDLRLDDNTGLIEALRVSESVIPAFIFDPRQADAEKNKYFSENAFNFMIGSLKNLDSELKKKGGKLYTFYGVAEEVVEKLIKDESITAVYINKDYTPFSKLRDERIEKMCKKYLAEFKAFPDALLNEPEVAVKNDGTPYTVFTPFWKNASQITVKKPQINNHKNYYTKKISIESKKHEQLIAQHSNIVKAGRDNALEILKNINRYKNYEYVRDYPSIEGTTRLSAHLKFGTISVREAYSAVANNLTQAHPLLRQFYWRDFFYHIAYFFPKVFGNAFRDKYNKVKWDADNEKFKAWKNGLTGFPIVDAGMRELNNTGYMHNRVRMITASFLAKDLHIDWRLGEKYFSQKLIDYDPCINNGNWQWSASTGCDAQPFFRIFNPWRQGERFDQKCIYIKKWVPELKSLTPEQIHNAYRHDIKDYPKPVVDHSEESKISIERYKRVS